MSAAPAQYKPMILNLFTEGSSILTYNFVGELHRRHLTQKRHSLFCCRTKSVAQNIRGFVERLLRAAHKVLGRRLWLSKQLRTTSVNGVEFASGVAFEVIVALCFKR